MTVCVAIKVHDCIVFAADSASSVMGISASGDSIVANIWQHGIKVFNLHKRLPVEAMTAGLGNFGPASISNLAKDLRVKLMDEDQANALEMENYTIEEIVTIAHEFFRDKFDEIDPPPPAPTVFEFWIGGYGARDDRGSIWKLLIQDGNFSDPIQSVSPDDADMVLWGGQERAISRLIFGFDNSLGPLLVRHGATQEAAKEILQELRQGTITPLVHASMPVQDAIDLADFLVDVTKKYFRFFPGANIVGGGTDIATVTKHEGSKWIKRKHYYPADLNVLEAGHVV